jgi:ABC-2 type transport system ATP-binding protein
MTSNEGDAPPTAGPVAANATGSTAAAPAYEHGRGAARESDPAAASGNGHAAAPDVLSTHGLTKQFGDLVAVDGLEISVKRGDVYGFLGPNGAGKTTVIRMILGLISPTAGYVEVLGNRVPGHRELALRHLGGFVDDPVFYNAMSARKNLWLLGKMSGVTDKQRIEEVLHVVGLSDRGDDKVGGFSHGMKQRLGIAQALLHRPDVIVLDEPTSGLDPGGMKDVRELIRALAQGGTTVILSSHLLHEVELVCTRAAIVNYGRVIVEGPVSELRPEGAAVKLIVGDQAKAAEVVAALPGSREVTTDSDHLVVKIPDAEVPEMVRRLVDAGIDVNAIVPAPELGLEDVFLQLTGEGGGERPRARKRGLFRRAGR